MTPERLQELKAFAERNKHAMHYGDDVGGVLNELIAELEEMTKMRDNIHRKLLNCDTARNGLSLMVSDLEAEVEKFRDLAAGNICGYCWKEMEERSEPGLKEENDRLRKQLALCKEQRDWYAKQRPLAQATIDQYEEEIEAVGKVVE